MANFLSRTEDTSGTVKKVAGIDYNNGVDDVVAQVCVLADKTTPTQQLAISAGGAASVAVASALPAGANAIGKLAANSGVDIGDVDVTSVPAPLSTTGGGTEATALRVTVASDSTGVLSVDDNGASLTVDGTVTAANTAGDVAHDSGDSGNPVKIGGKAIAHAAPTSVTANDRTHWHFTRDGVGWVIGGSPAIQRIEYLWTSAQTNDSIVTVSAGTIVVVTQVTVFLDEATTVGVACRLGFGASDALNTLPTDGNTAAGAIFSHPGMIPGSAYSVGSGSGVLAYGGDGENLVITTEAATSGAGRCSISYYTIGS